MAGGAAGHGAGDLPRRDGGGKREVEDPGEGGELFRGAGAGGIGGDHGGRLAGHHQPRGELGAGERLAGARRACEADDESVAEVRLQRLQQLEGSVPAKEIEAARAVGIPEPSIVRRILLPLALVSALPALVNFSIILTKETVILSMITVPEIMFETQTMMAETFAFAEATLVLPLFFWIFVEAISRIGRRLERRATHYLLERS